MNIYDLIVLGGGPAGYLGAERAAAGGLTVALFEKRALGGVCLNEGCIPSKALLHSAKVLDYANHGGDYGITVQGATLDHTAVLLRKNKVVQTLVSGVGAKMKSHKVHVIAAEATVTGKTADGFTVKANGETYQAKRLLIATGSVPSIPPIPGLKEALDSGFALTNREILDLESIPGHLVVVGGGVIGLEMASYFNSARAKVTVIEALDKIAGVTDAEISTLLQKEYEKKGVDFRLGCKVTAIAQGAVTYEQDGKSHTIQADKLLLSIGRRASVDGTGLESIGVYLERGAVVTDHNLRTNVPNVWAAGDVNGQSMLAHTAYREAEVAVNNMLGKRDYMRYHAIPSVIYTNPEVACVGETEQSAAEKGIDVKAVKVSMRYSGRYLAEVSGGNGICKLVVDDKSQIVGVHLLGSYASEMIYGAAMMIESGWTVDEIKELVFPHPTVCEVIREALFEL